MSSLKFLKKIKSMTAVTSCGFVVFSGICYYKNDEKFFDNILMPLTRKFLDAEASHRLAVFACKWNLLPKNDFKDPKTLVCINRKKIDAALTEIIHLLFNFRKLIFVE